MRSLQLTVPELQQRFKKVEVAATMQCAGNRRAEMKAMPAPGGGGQQIKGLDWDAGAIGTAVWGGVLLRDVLKSAGKLSSHWACSTALFVGGSRSHFACMCGMLS